MKLKLFILLFTILNLQIAISQDPLEFEETFEYSEDLAIQDFKTAVKLEDSDSLRNALRYYINVAKFDSASELGKFSKAKLDSIGEIEKETFQNELVGTWNWIWSGTNWGTESSPNRCDCQKYWKFDKDEIIVFEDNKEVERLSYRIEKDYFSISSGCFFIDVNQGKNSWQLRIHKEIENAYFLAERSKHAKLFLSLRLIPNCVCGCPEKRFEKNKFE